MLSRRLTGIVTLTAIAALYAGGLAASSAVPPTTGEQIGTYPRPAAVPQLWELHFRPGDLDLYVDPVTGDPYWFFTYYVENRTGEDHIWAPTFTLFTDAGEILVSGRNVPSRVVTSLKNLLANEFLEDQHQIIGEILQGREHAREGLVLWPARNLKVTEITLFIAGISGETATVTDPLNGEQHILRKTLQRNYLMPGNINPRLSDPAEFVAQRWVFR